MPFVPGPGQAPIPGAVAGGALGAVAASGALSSKAVEATKQETQKLVDSAKTGGFTLSEQGVRPLLDSVTHMRDKVDKLKASSAELSQSPMLGSHVYGQMVAAHDQKAAENNTGGALMVLDQFDTVLQMAAEALERAAGIYQEHEAGAEDTFKQA